MPTKESFSIYWESCVFISYMQNGSERSPILERVWEEVEDSRGKIVSSVITLAEMAYVKERPDISEDDIDAIWSDPTVEIVEFNPVIARMARKLIRQNHDEGRGLSGADAMHLAADQWRL